jgi:mono/diheme cytochrome c family protein
MMNRILVAAAAAALAMPAFAQQKKADDPQVKRGRYLVTIGGCNDCHTPHYPEKGGKVPEAEWLTGDALGWQGPWGTTYATNLRLYFQDLKEDEWVKKGKSLMARPPMPWFNVRAMTTSDLRAMYRYLRHLGPAGKPAPAYVPPGQKAAGPVVTFPAPPK